jgi:Fe-S-cluster containining protein
MLTRAVIRDCIANSTSSLEALMNVYDRIPATLCDRKTHCCSLLPEASLVEILAVIQCFQKMTAGLKKRLYTKLVEYFLLNPVKITSCPFLEGRDCLIYPDRFFGCRAYGLWSYEYYQKLSEWNREAKIQLQHQWKQLGITLPKQVVNFNRPYCREVRAEMDLTMDDRELADIWDAVIKLSEHFSPWHSIFQQNFFGDLSFLFSVLAFGFNEAVQLKYTVVRDILAFKDKNTFKQALENLPDFEI